MAAPLPKLPDFTSPAAHTELVARARRWIEPSETLLRLGELAEHAALPAA